MVRSETKMAGTPAVDIASLTERLSSVKIGDEDAESKLREATKCLDPLMMEKILTIMIPYFRDARVAGDPNKSTALMLLEVVKEMAVQEASKDT